jgi:hypothetical protein
MDRAVANIADERAATCFTRLRSQPRARGFFFALARSRLRA